MRALSSPSLALLSALVVAPLCTTARDASAGAFVTPGESNVSLASTRVLLVHDGTKQTLVEQLEVTSNAASGLWIRALPSRPSKLEAADATILDAIEQRTRPEEPHNEALRRSMFGPSVVTLLTKRLIDAPKPVEPAEPATRRKLELGVTTYFDGAVPTSTITQRPILPAGLVELITRVPATIDPTFEGQLASYLNRGWVIAVIPFRDPAPSSTDPAQLGPLQTELEARRPVVPLGLTATKTDASFTFFFASATAVAPFALEAVWDRRPWDREPALPGQLHVVYNRPLDDASGLPFLMRQARVDVPAELQLLAADLVLAKGPRADLELAPVTNAEVLPPAGGRGSTADLFACVLLGLTPLLYTPESWFLLWLGARSRTPAKKKQKGKKVASAIRLWSLYAIAVGLFWFFTLEGSARIAAILPALIGLIQVGLPYVDREPAPIRVQFARKKKGKGAASGGGDNPTTRPSK
ncbi:DUF2330 domain-containing protein [Myxococcota bacterium]|nr:DUF2330 domain-containing protein [Myxococcota bacterium]